MNFLRNFLASVLGTFVALGLLLLLLIGIATAITATVISKKVLVDDSVEAVFELNLNKPVIDRAPTLQEFGRVIGVEESLLGLNRIISSIKQAKEDEDVEGISLRSGYPLAGWAQLKAIRKALNDFKSSGKFIYAYADSFSQKGYYLSSVADSIFLNPMGNTILKGLASEVLYYKDFQEKYGAKMEVIRVGKYKSAVEPYLDSKMSEENRRQLSTLLHSVWETICNDIANARKMNTERINLFANKLTAFTAQNAFRNKLVDSLIYFDQYESLLKSRIGYSEEEDDELRYSGVSSFNDKSSKDTDGEIAVVYANGTIGFGNEYDGIGSSFYKVINKVANEDEIKAIVIRINSPGGSSLVSEIIWRSIEKAKQKKPVVVSMGNVAASGGYYIALPAEKIFAEPLTITGSIGVFAALPNVEDLTNDLGINSQHVETHQDALGYSIFESIQPGFKRAIEKDIAQVYRTFKEHVASARDLTLSEVEKIAQGRVWSGKKAVALGLVDAIGSLDDAIQAASALAGLKDYSITNYPKIEPNFQNVLKNVLPNLQMMSLPPSWHLPLKLLAGEPGLKQFDKKYFNEGGYHPDMVQMRMLYELRMY